MRGSLVKMGLLVIAVVVLIAAPAWAKELEIGAKGPEFSLPGVDGKTHSLADYKDKKIVVIIFTCNHCPVAKAYQDRIIQIQKDYAEKGVQIVAINSNSTKVAPADSFEHMKKRAKKKGYNFPYLRDENQVVCTAYGATCTPHVFLLDQERALRYRGRIDDNMKKPEAVKSHDLRNAIKAVLADKPVPAATTRQFGCSIKWNK